jgi:nucleotide-binding universal stress UspA family protein
MPWNPIVGAVDESPEGAWAATVAWNLAQLADTDCHLIHATRQVPDIPLWVQPEINPTELAHNLSNATRDRMEEYLTGKVPFEALRHLDVQLGKPKRVLANAAGEFDASLLVMGGKHHTALGRWIGGSTALHTVQTVDVPTLITIPSEKSIERVLVAVDLSYAAAQTIETARRFSTLMNATLKVIHVVEPMPDIPSYPLDIESDYHFDRGKEHFERVIGPILKTEETERAVTFGSTEPRIAEEAHDWEADVVVVGSHGRGWVERILVGSTTQKLIRDLPASLLVAPVSEPAEGNIEP